MFQRQKDSSQWQKVHSTQLDIAQVRVLHILRINQLLYVLFFFAIPSSNLNY